jgi:predicted nucleotide-binding protein
MNREEKIAALNQQIEEANAGHPADFQLWQQRTDVVLRNVLGDTHPLYSNFTKIRYTPVVYSVTSGSDAMGRARTGGVKQAISTLKAAQLEIEIAGGAPDANPGSLPTGNTVFIVHGHDDARKHEVARVVQALTKNVPVILHEQPNGGRTIIEKFEDFAATAGYAIVLGTGDDLGRPMDGEETDLRPRPRQNVVFELGFFFGALGRSKVALLHDENVERPSDTDGIVYIPIDPAGAWKMNLAREMAEAGIGIDWSGLAQL